VALLNEYLEAMSQVVFLEGGTLDKYIGDAVMAFWGAPRAQGDHALRACRAALAMQARLAELNAAWLERGPDRPPLRMRIGINSGEPVVGNIGGENRFNYTTLGDAVNLAARLEPACKTYGVEIMIGEATRAAAGDAIRVRELDVIAVYGKEEPVRVYELLGHAHADPGERAEAVTLYEQGLETFRARDFELAARYFEAALQVDASDGASALYLERSREFMLNPPPADWDFVERRRIK
jgi:adenylate cyclase